VIQDEVVHVVTMDCLPAQAGHVTSSSQRRWWCGSPRHPLQI